MIRRRDHPDGLPFRVYERRGARRYSIGYKGPDGKWVFRLDCGIIEREKIRQLRAEAIARASAMNYGKPIEGTFAALVDAWFERQEKLQPNAVGRRAASTLAENQREGDNLKRAFGFMPVADMQKADAYEYLDACLVAVDNDGNPRPRPEKGNKEIALARTILEYGIRCRLIKENPFDGVEKLRTHTEKRYVTDDELALALEMGRRLGGPQHIVALALKTAFLCVRRSVEVRALSRDQIKTEGIEWVAAKRQKGQSVQRGLIEWSDELKRIIDEARAIQRGKLAGVWHVFANMRGQPYTKGGWKKSLSVLMTECEREAAARGVAFRKFSLQDCRPKGVSDKLQQGADDVMDATLHTSERMIRQVYDRRRVRVAKPVR